jgi:hypothetical protein
MDERSILRGKVFIAILTFICTCCLHLSAQPPATESQVKAAYLLNFGKFVSWPASPAPSHPEEFSICLLGEDPFGAVLDSTVRGEKINGHPVIVRRLRTAHDLSGCNILYISHSEQSQVRRITSALAKSGILTVGDGSDFMDQGGALQFTISGNRVRFAVNLDAAHDAGLVLSSELLKVASSVHGRAREAAR